MSATCVGLEYGQTVTLIPLVNAEMEMDQKATSQCVKGNDGDIFRVQSNFVATFSDDAIALMLSPEPFKDPPTPVPTTQPTQIISTAIPTVNPTEGASAPVVHGKNEKQQKTSQIEALACEELCKFQGNICSCIESQIVSSVPFSAVFSSPHITMTGSNLFMTMISSDSTMQNSLTSQKISRFSAGLTRFNTRSNPLAITVASNFAVNVLLNRVDAATAPLRSVRIQVPHREEDDAFLHIKAIPLMNSDVEARGLRLSCDLEGDDPWCDIKVNPSIDYNVVITNEGLFVNHVSMYGSSHLNSISDEISKTHGVPLKYIIGAAVFVFLWVFFMAIFLGSIGKAKYYCREICTDLKKLFCRNSGNDEIMVEDYRGFESERSSFSL